ncbi:hypothetical protein [Corticicoccus populi]|uniref:Uncharacterized protein n=1 Tax=Corticicoccus populi TaxID=1812821 RepID=A0ABW5WXH0_9STAP
MYEYLNESVTNQSIYQILTEKEQVFYQKITRAEDKIAEMSNTAEAFIETVSVSGIYERAAREYGIPVYKVLEVLENIENRIDKYMEQKRRYETTVGECRYVQRFYIDENEKRG